MNTTPDVPFLNIHNLCANDRISIFFDKHSCMCLDTKDFFVKQISHLSKAGFTLRRLDRRLDIRLAQPVKVAKRL